MIVLREMGAKQTTWQILWHGEGEISLPTAIIEVVIMKMDSTVMGSIMHPVVLAPVPGVPLHSPGREIDGGAVPAVRRDIHYMRGRDATTEIPVSDNGVAQDRRCGLLQEGYTLRR